MVILIEDINLLYFRVVNIPKLRGHHLICLHFFNGKGYNREFIENLRNTLKTAAESGVEISFGGDDVCRRCPYLKDEKCLYAENSDDEIMEMDEFALKLLNGAPGAKTKWQVIKQRIPEIFPLWLERYCKKCCWREACEEDSLYRRLRYGL